MMSRVVQNAFEVVKFSLEMAQTTLYVLIEMQLAKYGLVEVSLETVRRDETADLGENGEITNREQKVQLLEGIRLFLEDYDRFGASDVKSDVVG